MQKLFTTLFLVALLPIVGCNAEGESAEATAPAANSVFSSNQTAATTLNAADLKNGVDYDLLPTAVAVVDPNKIEVTEIFWYGCIHCFHLEPLLEEWFAGLGDDVVLNRVPAIWHPSMELHARMFYANEALGLTEQLHWPLFKAMNEERKMMANEQEILDWVEDQGIDPEKYSRALNSFGVTSQLNQVKAKMVTYRVRGTPEMVINGKYHLTTTLAKTQENMLNIAKALIEQERAAKLK